ncbi:MAG: asparagine synthase (glutamine-hydrolyzing) [Cyclobacteriaceae bacterium]|nr:asparagine synthase (glutamine-hydrolyzing) [Cyclobacteriaceae bacterium]
MSRIEMCGFLFEHTNRNQTDKRKFNHLLSLSNMRGPDHSGYWTNRTTVQMGFNRLAILELTEAGNQPMVSPNGRYVLVFNGEIYNHLHLRQQLTFKNFKGHSDTETICACFDEWGISKTVEQLDGMFALAVFDQQTSTTTLVRDFAGIKPLFYGWDGTTLVAASQYDQVVCHPAFVNQPLNEQVLKLYLQQHYLPAPFGLRKQTFQVEPGEIVQLSPEGKLGREKYWTFPDYSVPTIREHKQAIETLSGELENSVRQELLSDVPLGAFLSGGIDSPLVCYYAKRHKPDLQTFTIGSDSMVHNEADLAGRYAVLLGISHSTSMMSDGVGKDILNEVLGCVHEPMADFSIIPTYLVSKLARQQVTVALSGDGGDELFFGYERFWSIAKNIRYQLLPWVVKAGLYKADQWLTGNKRINGIVLSASQAQAHQQLHSRFSPVWLNKLFPHLHHVDLPEAYSTYGYTNTTNEAMLIQHIRKAEFYGMMQKTLRKVDLASMGNSLEVRVPFLKKSFIEASLRIDPYLSYGPAKKKQLLKDLLQQLLPESPIDNVKRGFTVPLGHWIRKEMKEQFSDRLLQKSFLSTYGLGQPAVAELLEQHQQGRDLKWPIFTLTALSAWQHNLSA